MPQFHGKNGLIYIGGTVLTYANAWTLNITTDSVEVPIFGAKWKERVIGQNDWSGSISNWHDSAGKILQQCAVAGITYLLAIYPQRSVLTSYYSGNAIFGVSLGGGMDSAVAADGDFVGGSGLSFVGFT